jgi:hypothetical protein
MPQLVENYLEEPGRYILGRGDMVYLHRVLVASQGQLENGL